MDEILDVPEKMNSVYSKNLIKNASFFGGPLLGAYFMSVNYKAINKNKLIPITWLVALVVSAIAVYTVINLDTIPHFIPSIGYFLLAGFIYDKYQKEEIDEHLEQGGTYFPWWRGVMIILAVILLFIGPLVYYLFTNPV